jgi:hypothetical protein
MNRTYQLIFNSIGLVLLAAVSADAKEWRGLEPLRSTRLDVERVLGTSNDHVDVSIKPNQKLSQ